MATGLHGCQGRIRSGFVSQIKFIQLFAHQMGQAGVEGNTIRRRHQGLNTPIFACLEGLDLSFALTNQAQGDGLHPSGGFRARQLAPQNRRQGESDQIIQRAPGQIGFDQFLVQIARIGHRGCDGRFGDFIKDNAAHRQRVQAFALLQFLLDVPGNRFPFAIRVRCQEQGCRALTGLNNIINAFFGPGVDFPFH